MKLNTISCSSKALGESSKVFLGSLQMYPRGNVGSLGFPMTIVVHWGKDVGMLIVHPNRWQTFSGRGIDDCQWLPIRESSKQEQNDKELYRPPRGKRISAQIGRHKRWTAVRASNGPQSNELKLKCSANVQWVRSSKSQNRSYHDCQVHTLGSLFRKGSGLRTMTEVHQILDIVPRSMRSLEQK